MTFEQGQVVLFVGSRYLNADPEVREVTISRVARKYAYVVLGKYSSEETAFDKVTGAEKQNPNYPQHNTAKLYTHDGWAEKSRRDLLWKRFKDAGVQFVGVGTQERSTWSTEKLVRVVEALES